MEIIEIEKQILKFWRESHAFKRSVDKRSKNRSFVFFEGPPTANGRPGFHHVEARSFKDVICRYKTMKGFCVERRGGWDTHGLPIELGVEKALGIKKEDIAFKFHVALADMIEDVLRRLKKKEKIKTLALSGGVWQNRLLLEMVLKRLKKRYKVLLPKGVPFNDESVSLGQSGFLGSYNVNRGTLNV